MSEWWKIKERKFNLQAIICKTGDWARSKFRQFCRRFWFVCFNILLALTKKNISRQISKLGSLKSCFYSVDKLDKFAERIDINTKSYKKSSCSRVNLTTLDLFTNMEFQRETYLPYLFLDDNPPGRGLPGLARHYLVLNSNL